MRKSAEAIVEGINTLKSGYSMVVFPEGTRSKGGEPQSLRLVALSWQQNQRFLLFQLQ